MERYTLQILNGANWHDVISADTIAALKPHATNLGACYQVYDSKRNALRELAVYPHSAELTGKWK